MPIRFHCPHCAVAIRVDDHLAGKKGVCPKCAAGLFVPEVIQEHVFDAQTAPPPVRALGPPQDRPVEQRELLPSNPLDFNAPDPYQPVANQVYIQVDRPRREQRWYHSGPQTVLVYVSAVVITTLIIFGAIHLYTEWQARRLMREAEKAVREIERSFDALKK